MVNVIDYVPGKTLLHSLCPISKLAIAAGIIIATFLANSYALLIGLLALTLLLGAYAKVTSRLFSLLKLLVPVAVIMLLLQTAFMQQGEPVFLWMTREGLETGSKACLRLLGVALPLILMLTVTKLNDLANACVEILHVPYRYAFTFTTALRFVPVFGQEMNAIMEAQTARGVEYDTKNPLRKLQLMLPLCIPLLVSSVSKSDSTALAAEQRGFYLRNRTSSYKHYPILAKDVAALIFSAALIVLGILF
ncbi:MAG: energy-coupling factor transporter transmembrane component T family protein [Atopobiaceae bacterium]